MIWNTAKNTLPTKNGQYLITLRVQDENGEHRETNVAKFFNLPDGSYSWSWFDDGGKNLMNNKYLSEWSFDGTDYAEEIVAWMELPAPFEY